MKMQYDFAELEGFEVFMPTPKGRLNTIELKVQGSTVQLTFGAMKALSFPQYVNFFFDRVKRRSMVKRADEKMPNALKIKISDVMKKPAELGLIPCSELARAVLQIAQADPKRTTYFAGYVPEKVKDTLIFDLNDRRTIEKKRKEK